jgi:secondary thiamine-phosphate synthase enzyme
VRSLVVRTSRRVEAVDITDQVDVRDLHDGLAWLRCPHTTAALVIGESDPDMLEDYERAATELFARYEPFRHHKNDSPNAAAHLFSSLAGTQLLVPVRAGRLQLGKYQRVVFMELDGPREARIIEIASVPLTQTGGGDA